MSQQEVHTGNFGSLRAQVSLSASTLRPGLFGGVAAVAHFQVQRVGQGAIEVGGKGALKHHVQIVAIGPVLLGAELAGDHLVERRARQRIGDRDADIVGPRLAHQRDGLFDFRPGLAGIAELQKEAGADAVARAGSRAPRRPARARVPLSMASSTSCEPDSTPIQTSAQPARRSASTVGRVIRSQRDCILNGICAPSDSTASANSQRPLLREREDVVGEPEVVGLEARLDFAASPRPPGAPSGSGSCRPRSAWRTSCSDTGSRGWKPCSSRNSRAPRSTPRGTARHRSGPRPAWAASPDRRSARGAACAAPAPDRGSRNAMPRELRPAAARRQQQQPRDFDDGLFHLAFQDVGRSRLPDTRRRGRRRRSR